MAGYPSNVPPSYLPTSHHPPPIVLSRAPRQMESSSRGGQSSNVAGFAAEKSGAYGGSEVGALIGNAVGPPVIGGIIGNVVGEKIGQSAIRKTGLDEAANSAHQKISRVVGERNADKIGDVAMTVLGYGEDEVCVCCPCLPKSQVMLFFMCGFYIFNVYRLSMGIYFQGGCSNETKEINTVQVSDTDLAANGTNYEEFTLVATDVDTNLTTYLVSYPCEWGFRYLVVGAIVWLVFLPLHIFTLLVNCWTQCCCCLCDPLVCCGLAWNSIKRCCCEVGKFSLVDIVWYSMCLFQVIWACIEVHWLIKLKLSEQNADFEQYLDTNGKLFKCAVAAPVLDILFAGSELFHRVRYHNTRAERKTTVNQDDNPQQPQIDVK